MKVTDWTTPRGGGAIEQDKALASRLQSAWREEQTQRKAAQRLIDWYQRDRTKIADYIQLQAKITFGDRTKEWQKPVINGVRRTIKRLAMTYARPPQRKYFRDDVELGPDDPQMKNIERMYQGVRIDKRMREAERWELLLNTTHVEVVYRRGRIDHDIHRRTNVLVLTDPEDYLHYEVFARRFELPRDPQAPQRSAGFIVWSDDQYVFVRDDGWIFGIANKQGTNPFADAKRAMLDRPIPIITLRKTEGEDYWGRYGSDIVDSFEQAAIQLGNMWEDAFMQSGIVLATNTGLGDKSKGQTITIGLKDPITREGAIKEELPPNVEFKRPDTPLAVIKDIIDWYVKKAGSTYGESPSTWSQEAQEMSGIAKQIDNSELLEDRDEGLDEASDTEAILFEADRMVWNKWHPVEAEHIDEDIRCEATFDEIEFPESRGDKALADSAEIQNNTLSPIDIIMKKHKISDRDEAEEMVMRIVDENARIQKRRLETLGPLMMPGDGPPGGVPGGGGNLDDPGSAFVKDKARGAKATSSGSGGSGSGGSSKGKPKPPTPATQ